MWYPHTCPKRYISPNSSTTIAWQTKTKAPKQKTPIYRWNASSNFIMAQPNETFQAISCMWCQIRNEVWTHTPTKKIHSNEHLPANNTNHWAKERNKMIWNWHRTVLTSHKKSANRVKMKKKTTLDIRWMHYNGDNLAFNRCVGVENVGQE